MSGGDADVSVERKKKLASCLHFSSQIRAKSIVFPMYMAKHWKKQRPDIPIPIPIEIAPIISVNRLRIGFDSQPQGCVLKRE